MTGTYYFTTEISSSSTPRWVRADSLDASGQPRGPRKGSNREGVYSLELRTGNEIQLQNDVRSSTLGNACLFDAQPRSCLDSTLYPHLVNSHSFTFQITAALTGLGTLGETRIEWGPGAVTHQPNGEISLDLDCI
jgi:hypothetical protein